METTPTHIHIYTYIAIKWPRNNEMKFLPITITNPENDTG